MMIKNLRQGVLIVGVAAMAMTLAPAATAAQAAAPVSAVVLAQPLPPGYTIDGDVLYNANKQPVKLPAGFTIKAGVIYDATGAIAQIAPATSTAAPEPAAGTCVTKPVVDAPKKDELSLGNLISGIVAGALNLGAGVTQASLCYAGSVTQAVVGPDGLLKL